MRDHAGAQRVDVVLAQLDVRELLGNVGHHLVPQHHGVLQRIRLGGARQHLARTRLRQLERVARDPLDAMAGEDASLLGNLLRRAAVKSSADAAVLAL